MAKGYSSFKDLFRNEGINVEREVETVVHKDENIANNRLFVWNFEEIDLEEFIEIFTNFKEEKTTASSRQNLSSALLRKMGSMMREGYNPVECVLYASKIINKKLQNDNEVQSILAERIRDVYIRQEGETEAVLKNIIEMWSWVPQIKVVIMSIGLIGDNEELLDMVARTYMEDMNYRTKVFYAFMQNKTPNNLERVMKMIMNLKDTEEDISLGRIFQKDIHGFGVEGVQMVGKYYDNPAVSRSASKVLRKIMLRSGYVKNRDDEMYQSTLAKKSERDESAYHDFIQECRERKDEKSFFLTRFSRGDAGTFLKEVLEQDFLSDSERNTVLVSMGILGLKGYSPAYSVIDKAEHKNENDYAAIVAKMLLGDDYAAKKLVEAFCSKEDYELGNLYRVLKAANVSNYQTETGKVRRGLRDKFRELVENGNDKQLICLTSNFQMFWDNKLYSLLDMDTLKDMCAVLKRYAKNSSDIPDAVIISMIETLMHRYSKDFEAALFALYKHSTNRKIQELSYKKLKSREIQAPR